MTNTEQATSMFVLEWVPQMSENGYRWDGTPRPIREGTLEECEAEWSPALAAIIGHQHPAGMRDCNTIGKLAADGVPYALHVIGRGGIRVRTA